MSKLQRRVAIVEYIEEKGQVSFQDIKTRFPDTSDMTLRTDLKELDAQNKIIRIHGGAKSASSVTKATDPFFKRVPLNHDKKKQIALKSANYLNQELQRRPNLTIYLDGGSTIVEVAKMFPDEWCSIVTNCVATAYMLAPLKRPSITVLGGMLNRINCSCDSFRNTEELEHMNFDITVMPTSGYTDETDFTSTKELFDEMRTVVMRRSKKLIMVMDSTKIGKVFQLTHIKKEEIDILISDDDLPDETRKVFTDLGVLVL